MNVEGRIIQWKFQSVAEILKKWWIEDGMDLPDGDDEVLELTISEKKVKSPGKIHTFIRELEMMYWKDLEI